MFIYLSVVYFHIYFYIFFIGKKFNRTICSYLHILRRIFDIRGKMLKNVEINGNQCKIDCSDLHDGLYLLQVISSFGNYQQKIVIIK